MTTAPTPIERKQFGELADDVAFLRHDLGLLVAPFGGGFRIGKDVVDHDGLLARAKAERDRLERLRQRPPKSTRPVSAPPAPVDLKSRPKPPVIGRVIGLDDAPVEPPAPQLSGAAAIAKAKALEYSTDLGPRPRMAWLDKALLHVDHRYQREIANAGQAHVNRVRREFRWIYCQTVTVSERDDGTFYVIDGQHRVEAARLHPLVNELPCWILPRLELAQQADVFATVNGRRLGLTSLQKFWAAHAAGEASAVQVFGICQAHGVAILRNIPSYDIPPRSVLAPFTLQKMLRRFGAPAVTNAIRLLAETHGETTNAFRSPTMVALASIAAGKGFARGPWARLLKGLDLDKLYDQARADRVKRGGTLETATERVLRAHAEKAGA